MRNTIACLSSLMLLASIAAAGDLNPPAGPVAPTQRIPINSNRTPGDADSLFKITQPGSYYLTGNLSGVAGRSGIEIAANNVTIDLMGFSIIGASTSLDGITDAAVARSGISLLNGTVSGFGGDGIDLDESSILRLSDVRSVFNTGFGIRVGANAVVTACTASNNTNAGFRSGAGVVFESCTASFNTAQGFAPGSNPSGSFHNCVAEGNGNIGFYGFGWYTFANCTAKDNGSNGFFIGQEGASMTNCAARENAGDGFFILTGTCIGCVASLNDGKGIDVNVGIVESCMARGNGNHGIEVESGSVVRACTSSGNGTLVTNGAGVRTFGSDIRIEANNVAENDIGIQINNAGNIIIRNTAADNTTNYDIVEDNIYGPIIDRRVVMTAAVSGSTAGSTLGTTDENANWAY